MSSSDKSSKVRKTRRVSGKYPEAEWLGMIQHDMLMFDPFEQANEKYATDYPAAVGSHMTNTVLDPFKDIVATLSLRENERGAQIGAGWDPPHHQATDLIPHLCNDAVRSSPSNDVILVTNLSIQFRRNQRHAMRRRGFIQGPSCHIPRRQRA